MNQAMTFRLPAWELKYLGETKRFIVPAGHEGVAVTLSARLDTGTMTAALKVQRWTPAGLFDFDSARTLDMTAQDADQVVINAADMQGCQVVAVYNQAAQSGVVVDLIVTIEPAQPAA